MSLKSDSGKLRVVNHDPVKERRIKIILAVAVVLLGVFIYWYGGSEASDKNTRLQFKNETLQEQVIRLNSDNEDLLQRVAVLESSGKIDREAVNEIRKLVVTLESDKAELQKELAFYKNIMAPEDMTRGVRVAGIDLLKGEEPGSYRLRLVIAQIALDNPFLKGTLSVTLKGENRKGKTETLSVLRLAGYGQATMNLGFRYFQSLPDSRGFLEFTLPEGYTPETLNVSVRVKGIQKRTG